MFPHCEFFELNANYISIKEENSTASIYNVLLFIFANSYFSFGGRGKDDGIINGDGARNCLLNISSYETRIIYRCG